MTTVLRSMLFKHGAVDKVVKATQGDAIKMKKGTQVFDFLPITTSDSTNNERSPRDSPQLVKKKLRRLSTGRLEGSLSKRSTMKKENNENSDIYDTVKACSIVVTGTYDTISSGKRTILKKAATMGTLKNRRHIVFNPNVTVIVIGDQGEYVCTKCQLLAEPKQPKDSVHTKKSESQGKKQLRYTFHNSSSVPSQSSMSVIHQGGSGSIYRSPLSRSQSFSNCTSSSSMLSDTDLKTPQERPTFFTSNRQSASVGQINISFVHDSELGTKLKFVLHLGKCYDAKNVVVKANTIGSKLRVIARKIDSGTSTEEEFNERYILPMNVDPYMVHARLDDKGDLSVEAPLATLDREASLIKWKDTQTSGLLV